MTSAILPEISSNDFMMAGSATSLANLRRSHSQTAFLEMKVQGPTPCFDLTRSPDESSSCTTATYDHLSHSSEGDVDMNSLPTTPVPFDSPNNLEEEHQGGLRNASCAALSLELAAIAAPDILADILTWLDAPDEPQVSISTKQTRPKSRGAMRTAGGKSMVLNSRRRFMHFPKRRRFA